MEKDKIIILEDRGLISVTGDDAIEFLQNIITNDIKKVSSSKTIFSALFTSQGKYLYEFFILQSKEGYLLDCDNKLTDEIINYLSKYKLRSKIEIKNISSEHIIGVISLEKFIEIQKKEGKKTDTIIYRDSTIYIDPRNKKLGVRILSSLKNLHFTIKKLDLKITKAENYLIDAHALGVPIKGVENLKDKLFGLEANLEELGAIDFKKGCYIGQENTARMKLKNKLRKRLLPIKSSFKLNFEDELAFNDIKIGKILICDPYPFALIKLSDPDFNTFKNKKIDISNGYVRIINDDQDI
jgi:folate-binding protein YgfZ